MTPCSPDKPRAFCPLCARHTPAAMPSAWRRPRTLVIDASVVAGQGSCPMFVPKTMQVHWLDRLDAAAGDAVMAGGVW